MGGNFGPVLKPAIGKKAVVTASVETERDLSLKKLRLYYVKPAVSYNDWMESQGDFFCLALLLIVLGGLDIVVACFSFGETAEICAEFKAAI